MREDPARYEILCSKTHYRPAAIHHVHTFHNAGYVLEITFNPSQPVLQGHNRIYSRPVSHQREEGIRGESYYCSANWTEIERLRYECNGNQVIKIYILSFVRLKEHVTFFLVDKNISYHWRQHQAACVKQSQDYASHCISTAGCSCACAAY